jgi:hypothetical protein
LVGFFQSLGNFLRKADDVCDLFVGQLLRIHLSSQPFPFLLQAAHGRFQLPLVLCKNLLGEIT